jgi:Erv1 / Alr family
MGIKPEIWGPNLWGTLHLLCLTGSITPEFVEEFAKVIPCPSCAGHFSTLISQSPLPNSQDPDTLFEWSVEIHNLVNKRIGKKVVTVDEARQHWTSSTQFDFKIVIFIILLIALFFLALRK